MARALKIPIQLADNITSEFKEQVLTLKGPKGEMQLDIPDSINVQMESNHIRVGNKQPTKNTALAGTIYQLIKNNAIGVNEGYQKVLILVGVGYRAQLLNKNTLKLLLGYSHPIEYPLPDKVQAVVEETKITLTSCDKQMLGQVAADIRGFRPPEPYKGKGLHYEGEVIRRKAGKTGKTASS